MAIVKVSELQGLALDYAVAEAIGWKEPFHGVGDISYWAEERHGVKEQYLMMEAPDPDEPDEVTEKHHFNHLDTWAPSRFWSQAGPLIKKYNVMLSPPTSAVHRNYGYMDKRNGYEEAGFWGTTIFAKDRKHRRAAFHHKDDPLIPAMQAIVQFELGDEIDVPDELIDSAS